ncbi:(4Fe-4S)-binding protein [candidate division WOR-3 bacterium JGI_Cruoil_03_51_56]|uniref:(4Fe-4S)-binding protein n=1 Tax=candidate division WOR-3 bacterium JGI_Cruoil_03_51_56 TaxID=1973747 RepID=A0A235BT63_UNCW3|nr:MAG: (4Fe-4S)-binding protein [candidate division WOR-3 bacterium JGI_Cruoil_03_51_56]
MKKVKQIAVISGKGGTGKTVLTACFAVLAESKVLVDCDVDAADLHLLLHPEIQERHEFNGGSVAFRDPGKCTGCGKCLEVCRFDAVKEDFDIDPVACEGCGFCVHVCPTEAIAMRKCINGEWFVSKTSYGPMVHAALGPAEENSGKLVSIVRKRAGEIAEKTGAGYVIADGPPGIGCPVIASITGADLVLGVTEPSLSGIHDLERVAGVASGFGIRMCCVVNKFDINLENSRVIETWCEKHGITVAGRIPFDDAVTKAMVAGKTVMEFGPCPAGKEIRKVWQKVEECLIKV